MGDMVVSTPGSLDISGEFNVEALVKRRDKVKELMDRVLQDGTHYGKIPGIPRPTLFKSGAEALMFTFRFVPKYEIVSNALGNGHREVTAKCTLYTPGGEYIGDAYGIASTMESKYRWRKKYTENDVGAVPKEYWDIDRDNFKARTESLVKAFGPGKYKTKKSDQGWRVLKIEGDETREENPDIADTYNTILKMAQKRAVIAVVLAACGVSDLFTQDAEDAAEDVIDAQGRGPAEGQKEEGKGKSGKTSNEKALFENLTIRMKTATASGYLKADEIEAFGKRYQAFCETDAGHKQYQAMVVEAETLVAERMKGESSK